MAADKSSKSAAEADAMTVLETLKVDKKALTKEDLKDQVKKAFKAKYKAKKGALKAEHKANKDEYKAMKATKDAVKSTAQSSSS